MKYILLFLLWTPVFCFAQTSPYQDLSYESAVFGKTRHYRLYLPAGYQQTDKRYPVIYFFHGHSGRYNKEPNVRPEYEMLGDLVNKYQVILVMWDGNYEESNPAPYNMGYHQSIKYQVQTKDYFTEFVNHIDGTYRTLADRDHRGIIGFSMGGFMSMFIAGKYPDKVSAITNMVSMPEAYVGYPDNHTFYPPRYLFENLRDVSVRTHNMDGCMLAYLNMENKNGALWEGHPNFEYWIGHGEHKVDEPGETKLFEAAMQFIVNRFNYPAPLQKTWSHYDLYPVFDLWGYEVKSSKNEPGYLYLRNVSSAGFGFYTRRWVPDGPPVKDCTATVITAPVYKKGTTYDILLYRQEADSPVSVKEKANSEGRLHIELKGDGYEVGISHKSQPADFVVLNHTLDNGKRFIRVNKPNEISLTLLNRGGDAYAGKPVRVTVTCADPSVLLYNAIQEVSIDRNKRTGRSEPIGIACTKTPPTDASPPWIKLNVKIDCTNDIFTDAVTVPVFYDVPYFSGIQIDDGVMVRDAVMGSGNGNNCVEASERIMLYKNGQRLRLYTDDPYVEMATEELYDESMPCIWEENGITFSSVVKIADNCPPGHTIEFLTNYETKQYAPIKRESHWGKVKVTVMDPAAATDPVYKGHDKTRLRGTMIGIQVDEADIRVLGGEWGANHIRWQLLWNSFPNGPADTATIQQYRDWLEGQYERLERLLPVCEELGMLIAIDLHTPPGGRDKNANMPLFKKKELQEEFMHTWEVIATRFKGNKAVWAYDLLNEPCEGTVADGLMNWQELCAATAKRIRAIDAERTIIISAANWGVPESLDSFDPLKGINNLVYTTHVYLPHVFTHQEVANIPASFVYPGEIQGVYWDKEQLRKALEPVYRFQKVHHVHIYIGEFSALRWAPDNSAYRYIKDCIELFEESDWDWAYHSFRGSDKWNVELEGTSSAIQPAGTPTDRLLLLMKYFKMGR